jgi:hypothetical protein
VRVLSIEAKLLLSDPYTTALLEAFWLNRFPSLLLAGLLMRQAYAAF